MRMMVCFLNKRYVNGYLRDEKYNLTTYNIYDGMGKKVIIITMTTMVKKIAPVTMKFFVYDITHLYVCAISDCSYPRVLLGDIFRREYEHPKKTTLVRNGRWGKGEIGGICFAWLAPRCTR